MESLPSSRIQSSEQEYEGILQERFTANVVPVLVDGEGRKRGRRKPRHLLDRQDEDRQDVLACVHDIRVPFGSNQEEQDRRRIRGEAGVERLA